MVYAAEADIVCPAVAAEDPLGFLRQEIFVFQDLLAGLASAGFQSRYQLICRRAVCSSYAVGIQPLLSCCLYVVSCLLHKGLNLCFQAVPDGALRQAHAVAELCRILKQGVGPCRTVSLLVYGIRSGR